MSPRLVVRVDPGATGAPGVLVTVKLATGLGLADIRARVSDGRPVLDIEMFTNDWYDGGAQRVLHTLEEWDAAGIGWSAQETAEGNADGDAAPVTLDYLRNMMDADVMYRRYLDEVTEERN